MRGASYILQGLELLAWSEVSLFETLSRFTYNKKVDTSQRILYDFMLNNTENNFRSGAINLQWFGFSFSSETEQASSTGIVV